MTLNIGGIQPDIEALIHCVQQRFPEVKVEERHSTALRFKLPATIKKLSDVFGCVIEAMEKFQIDDYALSQTTLEDVFVGFAQEMQTEAEVK